MKSAIHLLAQVNQSLEISDYLRVMTIRLGDLNHVFCVSKCPPNFQHSTKNFVCVEDSAPRASE